MDSGRGKVNRGRNLFPIRSEIARVDPTLGFSAFNKAPVARILDFDAALDPYPDMGFESADLLGIMGGPFAHVKMIPIGHTGDAGDGVHIVALGLNRWCKHA